MRIGPNPIRGYVDEVSFHALLLSETEFRRHLPAVLQIHVLPKKSVYPENNREVMLKLYLGPEQTMETNPSTLKGGSLRQKKTVVMVEPFHSQTDFCEKKYKDIV